MSLRNSFLRALAQVIILLALFNWIAGLFNWYGLIWWFDMPMHFFGGVSVFYISAILWLPARKWVSNGRFLYESIITGLLLGVLWEGLELYLNIHYGSPQFILLDSLSDVCFDLAGIFLAAWFASGKLTTILSSEPKKI